MSDTTTTARPSLAAQHAADHLADIAGRPLDVTVTEPAPLMVQVTMPLDHLEAVLSGARRRRLSDCPGCP